MGWQERPCFAATFDPLERQITMADMKDSFVNGLSAMYNTEKLIIESMPALMKGIENPQAKQVLEQHAEETQQQVKRLDQIFGTLGTSPNNIQPDGILGIIKENGKIQEQGYDPATLEATTIGAAQRIEHYEIAGYGTLVAYSQQLGMSDVEQLLSQTLSEEKGADQKLTQAAESGANPQAAQAA